jgi:DNA-binding response OmpR family regulator
VAQAQGTRGSARALLIEADESYRAAVAACLRLAGCRVESVTDADAGLGALADGGHQLLVCSVPAQDRHRRRQVMAEIRARSQARMIVLGERADLAQVDLEGGASHWLQKPFVPGTLVGVVRAALRTSDTPIARVATRLEIRGIVLDGTRRRLTFACSGVTLTRQEWELISILFRHPDRFLAAREILRLGWRAGDHAAEQVRTYVHRLRQKLEPLGLPCQLLSQHGNGYRLAFDSVEGGSADRSEGGVRAAEASPSPRLRRRSSMRPSGARCSRSHRKARQ